MGSKGRRPTRNVDGALSVSITFDGPDAQQLREFMRDEDVPNANTAVRMLVQSSLNNDRRWWAAVRAQRRSIMWEFRSALYMEFVKHLKQMQQSVNDEIALFTQQDPSYGNANQEG